MCQSWIQLILVQCGQLKYETIWSEYEQGHSEAYTMKDPCVKQQTQINLGIWTVWSVSLPDTMGSQGPKAFFHVEREDSD